MVTLTLQQQNCLGIPGYTTINCPVNRFLPEVSSIQLYYNGESFLIPQTGATDLSGYTLTSGGVLGDSYIAQSLQDLSFGPDFDTLIGMDATISFFVKSTQDFTTSGTTQNLVIFNLTNPSGQLTFQLSSESGDVNLLANYTVGANSVVYSIPYCLASDTVFLSNWNNIILVRSGNNVSDVNIAVNGQFQTVTPAAVDGLDLMSNDLYIAEAGHSFSDSNTFIDQLAIWNTTLSAQNVNNVTFDYMNETDVCTSWLGVEAGAPTPQFTASYQSNSLYITVTVSNPNFYTLFDRLDTSSTNDTMCTYSNVINPSAGQNWEIISRTKCQTTYQLVQSIPNIYNTSETNNNWVVSLIDSGRIIDQQLPVFVSYSIYRGVNPCQTVTFDVTIDFQIYLTANSSTSFTTTDREASFYITAMLINSLNQFEVQGTLVRDLNNVNFKNIQLIREGTTEVVYGPDPYGQNCTYPSGNDCSLTYTTSWSTLNSGSYVLSGQHSLQFAAYENSNFLRDLSINFTLTYTVPQSPSIVTGNTLVSTITLTDSSYTNPMSTNIYQSSDSIYLVNALPISTHLPSAYYFTYDEGYFCCVYAPNPLPVYNGGTSGGCKTAQIGVNGVVQQTNLIPDGTHITVTEGVSTPLQYDMMIQLGYVLTNVSKPVETPLTCGLLLFSNFTNSGARRLSMVTSIDFSTATVVTTSLFNLQDLVLPASSSTVKPSKSNIGAATKSSSNTALVAALSTLGAIVAVLVVIIIVTIAVFAIYYAKTRGAKPVLTTATPTNVELENV